MAKGDGQTLEKLYIELGLDLSKLWFAKMVFSG